jgi:uncharacterized protein involved in oxidation of intracellular sulfur
VKALVILNDPPYGNERTYNALRLAGALATRGHEELRVFLMGDAAICAKRGQAVPHGYYNINRMLQVLALKTVAIGVCGSCMDARGIALDELVDGAVRSSLDELASWTEWAEKVLIF